MIVFLLLIIIVFSKCVSYIWEKRKIYQLHHRIKNNIKACPILGHVHLALQSPEDRMTSFQRIGEETIKQGGISSISVLHRVLVVLADVEIAENIFKNCLEKSEFTKLTRSFLGYGGISAPVAIWRQRRKMMMPAFNIKHLNGFVPIFDKNSRALAEALDEFSGKAAFPFLKYASAFAMDSICETTMDVQIDALRNPNQPYLKEFEEYSQIFIDRFCSPWLYSNDIFSCFPQHRKMAKNIKFMHEYVDEIIRAKRKAVQLEEENKVESNLDATTSCRKTLLDLYITPTFSSEGYTDLELREELLVITLAGTESTASGVSFIMMMLAMHQDVQDKVCQEMESIFGSSSRSVTPEDLNKMKYLDAVVRETLRLFPSIPLILRNTEEDTMLSNGLVLPKDTDILLNLFAMQRNPRHWGENAEQFDPSRFLSGELSHPAAFAAFSYGPRNCAGFQYGMMATKTVISTLVRRYHVLPAQKSTPIKLKYRVILNEVNGNHVRLVRKENNAD